MYVLQCKLVTRKIKPYSLCINVFFPVSIGKCIIKKKLFSNQTFGKFNYLKIFFFHSRYSVYTKKLPEHLMLH